MPRSATCGGATPGSSRRSAPTERRSRPGSSSTTSGHYPEERDRVAPQRLIIAFAIGLLAACSGNKPLALPSDPVDRAATCAVVAAAEARVAVKNINDPLP